MAKSMLLVLAAVFFVASAQQCANQLKQFQTCIETFAKQNPPPHPSFPPPPDFKEIKEKIGQCFTNNNCKNPFDEMTTDDSDEVMDEEEDEFTETNGIPPESGPPSLDITEDTENTEDEDETDEPFGRRTDWMEKKKKMWECKDQIAKENFEPTIQTCVQNEIPGWTFPTKPTNRSEVFDPYGEGPLSKFARFMKFKKHGRRPGPPPPGPPPHRFRRFAPPPFMRRGGGRRHKSPRCMFGKIANSIFNEDICPKTSRDTVTTCVTQLVEDTHKSVCTKMPAPPLMMLNKVKTHAAFCENRQTCYDQITDECRNDFWDQKWYITRCYNQYEETLDDTAWDAIEQKFKQCIASKGIDLDDDDDDDDENKSSEERGGPFGRGGRRHKKKKLLRMCIAKRYRDGPVMNPCKKIHGMYEFTMKPPHHFGPPGKGRFGPPGGRGRGFGRRPPFGHGPPPPPPGF